MNDTGWRVRGVPRLMFGRMFEDADIELQAFRPGSRLFAIASGGCTALALANAGHRVEAVDLNPAQVAYVADRIAGEAPRPGRIDGWLRAGLRAAPWLGMSRAERERFAILDDTSAQITYWRKHLATRRLRWAMQLMLSRHLLACVYSREVLDSLPPHFSRTLFGRLERGFAVHANRRNPFVHAYLLGDTSPVRFSGGQITVTADGAAEYLERVQPGSFDGFTLSNILDGASTDYVARLQKAIRRAAAPGAVAVVRRFAEQGGPDLASQDRALLWGSVRVTPVDQF